MQYTVTMTLQWYPGHMTKARRELAALIPSQDVIIEVIDARIPKASSNPLITELRRNKPVIKVLTKSDLADPAITHAWVQHFASEPNVSVFASTTERPQEARKRIAELSGNMAAHRGPDKAVRALIAGVPNVGKSTLLNTLMGKNVAKVGDKPAVTKEQQAVTLASGMQITDSPGLMWPKIEEEARAFRLALLGSIPDTAIDYLTIGIFGGRYLLEKYPELLLARYTLASKPPEAQALIQAIGRQRGALKKGGEVDLHRAAEMFVQEIRKGAIWRVSFEVPPRPPVTAAALP
jgi:ribosome biogenesis GTPase A